MGEAAGQGTAGWPCCLSGVYIVFMIWTLLYVMSFSYVYVNKSHLSGTFKRCSFVFGVKGALSFVEVGCNNGYGKYRECNKMH